MFLHVLTHLAAASSTPVVAGSEGGDDGAGVSVARPAGPYPDLSPNPATPDTIHAIVSKTPAHLVPLVAPPPPLAQDGVHEGTDEASSPSTLDLVENSVASPSSEGEDHPHDHDNAVAPMSTAPFTDLVEAVRWETRIGAAGFSLVSVDAIGGGEETTEAISAIVKFHKSHPDLLLELVNHPYEQWPRFRGRYNPPSLVMEAREMRRSLTEIHERAERALTSAMMCAGYEDVKSVGRYVQMTCCHQSQPRSAKWHIDHGVYDGVKNYVGLSWTIAGAPTEVLVNEEGKAWP